MRRFYILEEQIPEFAARMFAAGIEVSFEPASSEITVKLSSGNYEWIRVMKKNSLDDIYAAILPPKNEPNCIG